MKVRWKFGGNCEDSSLFDVGDVTLTEAEAIHLSYSIFQHYQKPMPAFYPKEFVRRISVIPTDPTPDADLDPETVKRAREIYGLPGI